MDLVNLNVDVLHLILDRSDRNTVSQMMKTCHFLNREGVQYLLRGGSTITNEVQAASFVQFALSIRQSADVTHRVRWMDSLHIRVLHEEEMEIVARVLKPFFILVAPRAPNFSVLEIDLAERFFRAAPELCASVASLKALKFLTLNEVGEKTVAVLRALRSRLTKAKVHFDLEIGPLAREDRDPIALLHRSQDTLRCISLMYAVSSPVAGCYRNARMLTLNDFEIPTTCHFVHAFPNLQYLRTTKCKARFSGDPGGGVRTQRDLNVAGQARDGSWGALTSYKGSLVMLYGLALSCQVAHVHIRDDGEEVLETWLIQPILGDTRPLHLMIAVRGVEDFLIQASEFTELSRSSEFQRLQSFHFKLDFSRESWDANLEALMVRGSFTSATSKSSPTPRLTMWLEHDLRCHRSIPHPRTHACHRYRQCHHMHKPVTYAATWDPSAVTDR